MNRTAPINRDNFIESIGRMCSDVNCGAMSREEACRLLLEAIHVIRRQKKTLDWVNSLSQEMADLSKGDLVEVPEYGSGADRGNNVRRADEVCSGVQTPKR